MDEGKPTECDVALKFWVRNEYAPTIERLTRLEERHEGALTALKLQAAEYERRLDQLNHAHAKAEADRGRFVTVELNDAYKEKVDSRFDYLTKQLAEIDGKAKGTSSTKHLIFEVVTLLIAAIAVGATVYLSVT